MVNIFNYFAFYIYFRHFASNARFGQDASNVIQLPSY